MKRLSEYLDIIGRELHDTAFIDDTGTVRPITKEEQLAREIWKRALGHEEEIENADHTVIHRTFAPDPKAQQFIFERLEGKFIQPQDDGPKASLLDKISDISKSHMNTLAKQAVDDSDGPESDA